MKTIRRILLFLIVSYSFPASAQKPLEELYKVLGFYKKDLTISYKLKITYKSETLEMPNSLDLWAIVHGKDCYYKMKDIEMFSEEGTMLTVDHNDKVMLLDKPVAMPGKFDMLSQLDSLTRNGHFYCSLEAVDDRYCKLILKSKSSSAYETQIIYQKENHYPKEIISPYVEDIDIDNGKVLTGTLLVSYSDYSTSNSPFPRAKYSIYKYVRKEGTKFSVTSAFKDYRILNNLTP